MILVGILHGFLILFLSSGNEDRSPVELVVFLFIKMLENLAIERKNFKIKLQTAFLKQAKTTHFFRYRNIGKEQAME